MSRTALTTGPRRAVWWMPWAAMAVVLVASLWIGSGASGSGVLGFGSGGGGNPAPTPAARIAHLDSELRCPSCADLSVSQSTEPSALAIRRYVVAAVHRGEPDASIVAFLESRYGPSILMAPKSTGPGAAIWWAPGIAVVAGVLAAAVLFRSRGGPAIAEAPSDEDRQLVHDAMLRGGGAE